MSGAAQACSTCTIRSIQKGTRKLKEKQILAPPGVDETMEWCKSFAMVPKQNSTVHLCLDPVRRNLLLIWTVHRGPNINDILTKLTNCALYNLNIYDLRLL